MLRGYAFLGVALIAAATVAGCGGGGGSNNPLPRPSSTPTSAKFIISVPLASAADAARKPSFDAPGGTRSVSITLTSVDGNKQSAPPAIVNVSASAPGCSAGSTTLTCTVTVGAVPGTDLYTVTSYSGPDAQGTALGTGTASVSAVQGQTATAPVTLSGTVASISLSLGTLPIAGAAATIPLVVIAKDANGATIMGTYDAPIVLSDTDTSGATKLSASSLAGSSDAAKVTIAYTGATLSPAPSIGAAAGSVAASPLAFTPNDDYSAQNGATLTYDMTLTSTSAAGTGTPSPASTDAATITAVYSTGASFNGQSNLIDVRETGQDTGGLLLGPGEQRDYYYSWVPAKNGAALFEVGDTYAHHYSDGHSDTSDEIGDGQGWEIAMVPFASGNSWNRSPGYTSTTIRTLTDGSGNQTGSIDEKYAQSADGSYTGSIDKTISQGYQQTYEELYSVFPNGSAQQSQERNDPDIHYIDVYTIGTPEPAPSGSPGTAIKYTDVYTQVSPAPVATATPSVYYGPNWYPNGVVPQPLASERVQDLGTESLPAECNVSASLATSAEHIQAKWNSTNPWGYTDSETDDDYYTPGIGLVCSIDDQVDTYYSFQTGAISGVDHYVTAQTLTAASLKSALRRAQSMSAAASSASAAFQALLSQRRGQRMVTLRERRIEAQQKRLEQLLHGMR